MSLLALLVLAAPARAGDPVMPLADVRAGMQCQALSVIKGVEPVPFGAEVLDVVEGDGSADGPRILVRVFGSAVDETGVGPGFSGSPIYCPDAEGRAASIGAISESIGEYGGKVALATPMEAIIGNPPEAPAQARKRPQVTRRARSLSAPLTVSGLSRPLARLLGRTAARRGVGVIAVPSGPLRRFPPQVLRPGSAMGVGYSSGDVAVGSVGTVAYVDGDRVWSFGHPLDAAGRRNLLLQDAYVYDIVNNPNAVGELGSTYKLAAVSHDVGTLSNDALSAVVGRMGTLPRTVPVRVTARDQDTGARQSVNSNVADETDVEDPLGSSLVTFVAPLAIAQATTGVLRSTPGKVSGDACVEIRLRELKEPLRFCNRYVGDSPAPGPDTGIGSVVAAGAGADAEVALTLIGSYTGRALHVTSVDAGVRVRRGADLAYMRDLKLPRRVRPGQRVTARLVVQRYRGRREVRRVRLRVPSDIKRGSRRIILQGTDADFPEEGLFEDIEIDFGEEEDEESAEDESALDFGPQSIPALREAVEAIERYDGVRLFVDRTRGEGAKAFRDPETRLSGRVSARVRVARRR